MLKLLFSILSISVMSYVEKLDKFHQHRARDHIQQLEAYHLHIVEKVEALQIDPRGTPHKRSPGSEEVFLI